MQQKHIDLSLAFIGAAIGIASDLNQYNGNIGVGTIMGPIVFPAIVYRLWDIGVTLPRS